MRISTKTQMYDLLKRGVLGNTVRHYGSLEELMSDETVEWVGCRCLQVNRPWRLYCCRKHELLAGLRERGYDGTGLEFYESPPDAFRRIQGELMRGPWGLQFRYTFAPGPMRLALESNEQHAWGLEARMLLQKHADPACYDWLMDLLDTYDGHVVEFTSYSIPVGVLQQPWLIWEVRAY